MNRDAYLRILRAQLDRRIPAGDLEDIMRYYEEYFEDAGADREQTVIAELGSPEHLAKQILGERTNEGIATPAGSPPHGYRTPEYTRPHYRSGKLPAWAFVLICIGVALVTCPVWMGVLLGLGVGGLGCVGAGIALIILCFWMPTVPAGILMAGGGLLSLALGLLMVLGTVVLIRLIIKGVRYLWRTSVEGEECGGNEAVQ